MPSRNWRDGLIEKRLRHIAADQTVGNVGQFIDSVDLGIDRIPAPGAASLNREATCDPDQVVVGEPLNINPDSYDRISKVRVGIMVSSRISSNVAYQVHRGDKMENVYPISKRACRRAVHLVRDFHP